MTAGRFMVLGAFLYPTGYHVAAWRHPEVPAAAGIDFGHYAQLARTAEQASMDFIFLPDSAAMRGTDLAALSRTAIRYVAQFEPMTLLSALATTTSRVGLTATLSSTYNQPYQVARAVASLDHISAGRAGWNLVTSQNPQECLNFGYSAQPTHADRYARAEEFVDVVKGLWDTWDDDAFVRDKASGRFFDPAALAPLNHRGQWFTVRGPLNMPRPPQGHPVTLQAGSSQAGRALAARTADVVFTAQPTLASAREFYQDVKSRAAQHGRCPDDLLILAGLNPFVGRTRSAAEAKFTALQDLIDPAVGLSLLASELGGLDLTGYPLDGPLPALPPSNAGQSRQQLLVDLAEREGLTIRQLYLRVAGPRGHWQLAGTADDIADALQQWIDGRAADGFIIMPPQLPGSLDDFTEMVIPRLQDRGLFRRDYTGQTLREHLSLPRPGDRRAAGPACGSSDALA
jgi:FMN-dependent oxidoreductase (nitrilotriacetate monooxygenase family)